MWTADWYVRCEKCSNQEYMDGRTLRDAQKTARKAGWVFRYKTWLCPTCGGGKPVKSDEETFDVLADYLGKRT